MHTPMPEGIQLSANLPDSIRLSIADSIIVFGRMEQEIIEISWILKDADLAKKLKLARNPATENFLTVLEIVEKSEAGLNFDSLKKSFKNLADERNLMVHGSWVMTNERPWVVWHKFLEDDQSIIGEHFESWRFERFMKKAEHMFKILKTFHIMLEQGGGVRTSAIPRS